MRVGWAELEEFVEYELIPGQRKHGRRAFREDRDDKADAAEAGSEKAHDCVDRLREPARALEHDRELVALDLLEHLGKRVLIARLEH